MDELEKLNAAAERHARDLADLTSPPSPLIALAREAGESLGEETARRETENKELRRLIAELQQRVAALEAAPLIAQLNNVIGRLDVKAAEIDQMLRSHGERI